MTSVEPLTREELLELASLDAFGLLDDFEAKLFTRSFHVAPATVQDEVLRMQAEVAGDLRLLPGEMPDPALRERVLKAVAAAIARGDEKLAPLARIGRRRRHDDNSEDRFGLNRSGLFWRAASFVMAGASLIMAYFLAIGYQSSTELARAAIYADAKKLEVLLKPPNKTFLLDDSVKVNLNSVDETVTCEGALYLNERTRQVLIVVDDLPRTEGREYVLQVQRKSGGTEPLQAFAGLGGFDGIRVDDLAADLFAAEVTWQIAELATGAVLLTSAGT